MKRTFVAITLLLAASPALADKLSSSIYQTAVGPLVGGELIYCVQGGVTKKCLARDVAATLLTAPIAPLPGLGTTNAFPSSFGGAASFGLALPNAAHPWVITGTANSIVNDNAGGLLYVAKTTAYGSPGLGPGTAPAIYAFNQVADGVWGNQQGLLAVIYNSNTQHSQPLGSASAVATYGTAYCIVANCSATWGGVIAGYDTSGQANPPSALYGLEIDNYANGPDNNGQRIGLQVTAGKFNNAGAANVVTNLLLLGNGDPTLATFGNFINGSTSQAVNGLNFGGMVFTGNAIITPGYYVDKSGNEVPNSLQLGLNHSVSWGVSDTGSVKSQIVAASADNNVYLDDLAGGDFVFRKAGAAEIARVAAAGSLIVASMPTACTGRPTGTLWKNGTAVNVCP